MTIAGLNTHRPSGAVPFPLVLLEGEEKAGKSWSIAELSRSERVGTTYWLDLNEGAAEEYGSIPGARYEVVEWPAEGPTYAAVLRAVELIKAEAQRAADAGEPPVVLAIDSATAIWNGLKDWASERATKQKSNREALARDPNAEVRVTSNLWNDAGARWRKIQFHLATFPGIVVASARGKEVAEIGPNGQPIEGRKTWSVETHKELPYAATLWVRLRRDADPEIVGARSVHAGIKPGADRPKKVSGSGWDGRLLEWLIFDVLRCDPAKASAREFAQFTGGELTDDERAAQVEAEATAIAEARGDAAAPARGQQRPAGGPQQGQGGPAGQARAAARNGGPKPPTVEYTLAKIAEATDGALLDTIHKVLEQHGMLGVEVEVGDVVLSLEDRIRARREQLAEAAKKAAADEAHARKVAAANAKATAREKEQRAALDQPPAAEAAAAREPAPVG